MVVLGISGRRRDAAAAIAVDGHVVAAVSEDSLNRIAGIGYRHTAGFPYSAVRACLTGAGLSMDSVDVIAVARDPTRNGDHGDTQQRGLKLPEAVSPEHRPLYDRIRNQPVMRVSALQAQAQLAAAGSDCEAVLVLDVDTPSSAGIFLDRTGGLTCVSRLPGFSCLARIASGVADALGERHGDPFAAMERLGATGEPELVAHFGAAMRWDLHAGVVVNDEQVQAIIDGIRRRCPGKLDDPANPNIHAQQHRRALATSFHCCFSDLVCEIAGSITTSLGTDRLAVGGRVFSSSAVNARLNVQLGGGLSPAPVPEASGRAIGAALVASAPVRPYRVRGLALGPQFTEPEMKAALENCRLDYVYEPLWPRLLGRVSAMLAGGKTVSWLQGPMDFGPRSLGSRSILCDPSNRYARDNVNRYLKRCGEDQPLALSMTEQAAAECLEPPVRSPFMLMRARVKEAWRDRLRAVVDRCHTAWVHTVCEDQAPEFHRLLELHYQKTGVPGLINSNLSGDNEPTACTPRDAIRTTFSAPIDALVMGRFLVMKDYWLLRSDADL